MIEISKRATEVSERKATRFRKSLQPLLPQQILEEDVKTSKYSIYPYHSLGAKKIFSGYPTLAAWIVNHKQVVIDGYGGVLWEDVQSCLQEAFTKLGVKAKWIHSAEYIKPVEEINEMIAPFLGTEDSLWGKKCNRRLQDFFDVKALQSIKADEAFDCTIIVGVGAALCNWKAPVIYLDVPKNEVQYRMRANTITNLGAQEPESAASMYKRFYFVDWVVLNNHKKSIFDKISILADAQWKDSLNWTFTVHIKSGLEKLSKTVFRVRPWFEPGAWGGQWMKEQFDELDKSEVNYAWSFELIVPENGLVFESDGFLLEISFDFLMFYDAGSIVGEHSGFFGDEFPIRFDFLDTWDGGNLSIQCHPSLQYIREEFGESITQDETYYILDCKEDAKVYLGFQEDIDPEEFKDQLENSRDNNQAVQVEKYVQSHQASKHDLFLIPNGTIHSAGANNLVLEISATPYIFTFKMYDWLRLDLNGEPRAINIEHAFNNLKFDRKGEKVKKELISKPTVIKESDDWKLLHLPTHEDHFYDVHRIEFDSKVVINTDNSCHVLMLVEGSCMAVEINGETFQYNYAETFVIPAAAQEYILINKGSERAKVVKAFIKKSIDHLKK